VAYAISRLRGLPLKQVVPLITNDTVDFASLKELLDHPEHAFGDVNVKATVQAKLHSLKQKNRDFHLRLADLRYYAADSCYGEDAQKSMLTESLSSELRYFMIAHDMPESLKGYIKPLRPLDSRYLAIASTAKSPFISLTSPQFALPVLQPSILPPSTLTHTTPSDVVPMGLSASIQSRKLTPDER